jgi:penicillin-binding protein 1A
VTLTATVVVACVMLVGASLQTLAHAVDGEGFAPLELLPLSQRSRILAADGSVLATVYDEDRVKVAIAEVPKVLRSAVIAVEDSAFYEHEGVSVPGMARALKNNTQEGRVTQGGSTITQQLVKTDLLTPDRTASRKVREAILAHRVEQQYTKDQILERYLNTVYFGEGAHGVFTAAQRYFGKSLGDLTLGEAALIAGQIASPALFSPFSHHEAATRRRSHVLDRMVAEGFATPAEAEAAEQEPLPTELHARPAQPDDYFAEEVRRRLLDDSRLGETRAERRNALLRGGLTVHTTLDPRLQGLAEHAVDNHLPPSDFTAALVSMNPANGDVVALVGGRGFERAKFNLATQGARQPGSSFKTVALAAALADGYTTGHQVQTRAPCVFDMPAGQEPWKVLNYDGDDGGQVMTLREATVKSSNCAYARLSMDLGAEKIAAMARQLGITRHPVAVPSIALGALEASPLEMAAVNAALAAQGTYHVPRFVTNVVGPDGEVVFENQPRARKAMHHDTALRVTDVLTEVIQRGTGRAADIGRPAAGKTGTSQEWRDAWFNGFTPFLATSVWMGHPEGQVSMHDVGGRRVTGGSFPAQIWAAYMGPASEPFPPLGFHAPPPEPPSGWIGEPARPKPPRVKRDTTRDEIGGDRRGPNGDDD